MTFKYFLQLSGLDRESILHGERRSTASDVHFVVGQILPNHGAFLGLTVFSYMQKLLQSCTHPNCSSNPVNQSLQQDSVVTSFNHTLSLCLSLHNERSTEALTHPWNQISDLDLCYSTEETGERFSLQHSVDNLARPGLGLGPEIKELEDTDSVQSAEMLCTGKSYGSKGCAEIRCSTLQESCMSVNISPCHVSEMIGSNHWSTPTTESSVICLEKPFYFWNWNHFSINDAPLSESLEGFLCQNDLRPISDNNLCKRDQVMSARKKIDHDSVSKSTPDVGTSPTNELMFTALSDITNAKPDTLLKAALTPSCTSSSKTHTAKKDLWFPNDPIDCNKLTNGKRDDDGFNCSSDLFQQSTLDTDNLGVAETLISTTKQKNKDFVTKRRPSSFNFAPSLQSTPISSPYQDRTHGQWCKRAHSRSSKKQMIGRSVSINQPTNIDATRMGLTEKPKAELNENADSDSAFKCSVSGFEEEKNEHLPEGTETFNEYSRDLFDHSF